MEVGQDPNLGCSAKEKKREKKIKLSLCLIKQYVIKTYGEVEVQLHPFLFLAQD
jgi:hypothetical protein